MSAEALPIPPLLSAESYRQTALTEQLYGITGTSTHADGEYRLLAPQRSGGGAVQPEFRWTRLMGSGGTANFLTDQQQPYTVFRFAVEGMADRVVNPSPPIATAEAPAILEARDLIAEIKATLGVNITELAAIAKVSRQTVYDWLDHGPISAPHYDRLFALRKIGLQWKTLANQPIGRLMHARTDDQPSLFERLLQDPLDVPAIPPLLAKLAARQSQNEESRQQRRRQVGQLADKAHYENLLTHVFPATDS